VSSTVLEGYYATASETAGCGDIKLKSLWYETTEKWESTGASCNNGVGAGCIPICYSEIGDVQLLEAGTPTAITEVAVTENADYYYDTSLNIQPTKTVTVNIVSEVGGDFTACAFTPISLTFTPSNWNISIPVTVIIEGDEIDQGGDTLFKLCNLKHTVVTTDPLFLNSVTPELKIRIQNDDVADNKLVPVSTVDENGKLSGGSKSTSKMY